MRMLNGKLDPVKFAPAWLVVLITRNWEGVEFANLSPREQQDRVDKVKMLIEDMVRKGIIE